MKISMQIKFCTDGDFYFLAFDNPDHKLIDTSSPLYNNCVKELDFYEIDYEDYRICLECYGERLPCIYAVRDVLSSLIKSGIRVSYYYLLEDIYRLLATPINKFLWSDESELYYDMIGGNYEGTYIEIRKVLSATNKGD